MIKYLLPKATVVTPNLFEAGQLSGLGKLTSIEDMKKAAKSFMIEVLNILLLKVVKHCIKINLMTYIMMVKHIIN